MLAENNPALSETAQTLFELNADDMIEQKCRARRDYYKQQRTTEKIMNDLTTQLEAANSQLEAANSEIEAANSEIEVLKKRIAELEASKK